MYRYTYLGYYRTHDVQVRPCDEVYYSVIGYHEERVFVYIETPVKDLDIETVVQGGDFILFPDGRKLFRMEQIFYCDPFTDDSILCLPREERRPCMSIMMLDHDAPILAYIGHHYVLQENGKTVWNRYYSIYEMGNTLISVSNEESIPAPERPSPFAVEIGSIIEATRAPIDNNRLPYADGTVGWRRIEEK